MRSEAPRAAKPSHFLAAGLLAVWFLPPDLAFAQAPSRPPPEAAPGSRIRFEAPGFVSGGVEATIVALDEESLVVRSDGGDSLTVPRASITKAEVRSGRRAHKLRGALIGAALGVVALGIACEGDIGGCAEASPIVTGSALAGTGVGALFRTDRWQPLSLDRVGVSVQPVPRGARLAVSIAF